MLLSPFLLNRLVKVVGLGLHAPEHFRLAIGLAVGLGISNLAAGLFAQHYFYQGLVIHQIFTNFINRKIFTHSLFLTQGSRLLSSTGDVVNHMSSDCDVVADLPIALGDLSIALLTIVGATVSLFYIFGSTAFLSLVIMTLMVPITRKIAIRFTHLEDELMQVRDQRITLMTQILNGIRIVKYFVWEKSVRREIDLLRNKELESRWQLVKAESHASIGYIAVSVMVLFITLTVHVWRGGVLDASSIFTAVALFQLLADPFGHLSQHVSRIVYARVGAERILAFLKRERLAPEMGMRAAEPAGLTLDKVSVDLGGRRILRQLSFSLDAGQSVAVVGPVGSGKTTLLHLLLGEENPSEGKVTFTTKAKPRFAYVPQEAYIINDTLRANILFGHPELSPSEWERVLVLTNLARDIAALPAGLDTEIGERGVNLSGGQKQRVSLARAFLHKPSVLLLDDPLSAVDPRTEALLVRRLLFNAWSGVTRVVVTHRLAHLREFDRIAFMQEGSLAAYGSFDELWDSSEAFRRFVSNHAEQAPELSPEEAAPPALPRTTVVGASESLVESNRRLTDAEERQVGAVKSRVYWDYMLAMGGKVGSRLNLALLGLGVASVAFMPLVQRLWLAHSSNLQSGGLSGNGSWLDSLATNRLHSVLVYGALGIVGIIFLLFNDLFWIKRGLIAGRDMHDDMLDSVLGARVRFFDATPIGRVLQRFSRDVESIDVFLQAGFKQTVVVFAEILVSLVLILATLPLMIFVLIPVGFLYYELQKDYRGPARESKRLDAISRSPRYAHFKETLQGLTVIRAFAKTELFLDTFYRNLSHNQKMFRAMYMLNRWFSSRIPLLGAVVATCTVLGLVLAARSGHISTGLVGVTLVYLLTFWQLLNRAIRWFSELEARMTSVERMKFYSSLEAEERSPVTPTLPAWPGPGAVEFKDVSVRYAEHFPEVLKELNFSVPAGSRVGIVGRTGSGKSTIIQALYRCMELSRGQILIDGVDIKTLSLAQLRRALAIIPQDPILFVGSLRSNLDRYNEHTDSEVWHALERSSLASLVRALPKGLETPVVENGMNFSQGQRQLLCLARALLARARLVIMDEATASVDVATDDLVQKVVRESCQGITMLIIAHRLATVEDADLILEIEQGRLKGVRSGPSLPQGRPWN